MQKQLEQYFGCKVKIAEYKNKLQFFVLGKTEFIALQSPVRLS